MYKNSSAPLNNAILWHYLGTKCLNFKRENISTPGILIEDGKLISMIHHFMILELSIPVLKSAVGKFSPQEFP